MRRACLLTLSTLWLCACPSAPPPKPDTEPTTAAPVSDAKTSIRPEVRKETLANGLDVYLVPDHSSPLVVVQIWVRAGSRDEREKKVGEDHGTTGLSHFFEHLMFQGTTRFPSYDDALTPLGAQNNAFTYQDSTVFWAYTPKEHLALILDIEADRFAHMKVDFLHLEPEREVVKNERRERTDSNPAEVAEERAVRNAFDVGGYRWGTIGWMSDLDSITLEEAQAYHAAHYHSRGAYLVIAGDFEPDATLALVKKLWGPLPKGPEVTRPTPAAETWVGPRNDHVLEDSPTTSVIWAYRAPAPGGASARTFAALELIDWVLTAGKTGRLQKRLVVNDSPQLSELGASLFTLGDPWIYKWRADLLPGVSVATIEAALDEEFRAIAQHGISPDELTRAVAGLRTDVVHGILSNSDRAEGIGFSLAATGDPFAQFTRLESYPTITQDELKQAAATLVPAARSRVTVITPDRLTALVEAWTSEGEANFMARPFLKNGAVMLHEQQAHRRNVAEADREARAIALLAQRADVAKAKSPADAAAIDKYLSESESGVVARRARLATTREALAKKGAELDSLRAALLKKLVELEKRSAARLQGPLLAAAKLMLAPWDEAIAVPLPPKGPMDDRQQALQVVAAWVLESRGLAKSAQRARDAVIAQGMERKPTSPLGTLALELARDTSVEGLELQDVPLAGVRRTNP